MTIEERGMVVNRREFVGFVVREKEMEVKVFKKKEVEEEKQFVSPFNQEKKEILVVEK